jgi:hypothetical protein
MRSRGLRQISKKKTFRFLRIFHLFFIAQLYHDFLGASASSSSFSTFFSAPAKALDSLINKVIFNVNCVL